MILCEECSCYFLSQRSPFERRLSSPPSLALALSICDLLSFSCLPPGLLDFSVFSPFSQSAPSSPLLAFLLIVPISST